MNLFLVTAKSNHNPSGATFTKGMTVEVQTSLSSPFHNSGQEVIAAFVQKYGTDASRLTSLSPTYFEVKKLS